MCSLQGLMLYLDGAAKTGESRATFTVRRTHALWDAEHQADTLKLLTNKAQGPINVKLFPSFVDAALISIGDGVSSYLWLESATVSSPTRVHFNTSMLFRVHA